MDRKPTAAPDNPQLTDASLLQEAMAFAHAADALAAFERFPDWFTLHFLIGRAAELALKAHALKVGASERFIRNDLGHDLEKAVAHAEAHGLNHEWAKHERGSVMLLGYWYRTKLLEYPLVRGYKVPHTRVVREALDKLIGAVFASIWGPESYSAQRHRAGLSIDARAHYDSLPPQGDVDGELTG